MAEDIKKTITIYNYKAITSETFKEVIKNYKAESDYEINLCEDPMEVRQFVEMSPYMMVFVGVKDKKSIVDIMTMCTFLKESIKLNFVKILVYNHLDNPKVEELFQKGGISDFLEDDISQKSLEYKIDLIFRTIKNNYEKHLISSKKNGKTKTFHIRTDPMSMIKFIEPINESFELWSITSKKNFNYSNNIWDLEVKGPPGKIGRWEHVEGAEENEKWKWMFLEELVNDEFCRDGEWIFIGHKPEYHTHDDSWKFVGQKPELFLFNEKPVAFKIKSTDDEILVSEDSRNVFLNLAQVRTLIQSLEIEDENEDESGDFFAKDDKSISTQQKIKVKKQEVMRDEHGNIMGENWNVIDNVFRGDVREKAEDIDTDMVGKGGSFHEDEEITKCKADHETIEFENVDKKEDSDVWEGKSSGWSEKIEDTKVEKLETTHSTEDDTKKLIHGKKEQAGLNIQKVTKSEKEKNDSIENTDSLLLSGKSDEVDEFGNMHLKVGEKLDDQMEHEHQIVKGHKPEDILITEEDKLKIKNKDIVDRENIIIDSKQIDNPDDVLSLGKDEFKIAGNGEDVELTKAPSDKKNKGMNGDNGEQDEFWKVKKIGQKEYEQEEHKKELDNLQINIEDMESNYVVKSKNQKDQHSSNLTGSKRSTGMEEKESDKFVVKGKTDNDLDISNTDTDHLFKTVDKQVDDGTWEGGGESADEIDKYWRDKEHQLKGHEKEYHGKNNVNTVKGGTDEIEMDNWRVAATDKDIHLEKSKKKETILKNSVGNWMSEDEFLKQLDDDVEVTKVKEKELKIVTSEKDDIDEKTASNDEIADNDDISEENVIQMPQTDIDKEVQNLDLNLIIKKLDAEHPNDEARVISSENAQLVDVFDNYVVITDSAHYELTADKFELTIKLDYLSDHFNFIIIGQLDEILPEIAEETRLIFKISKKHVEELGHIKEVYEKRQHSINSFLKKAKGF